MTTLYLAPLRGLTDAIFRNAFAKHFGGFDLAVAPFVTSVKGNKIKPTHIKDLAPEINKKIPVIPQILSKNPEEFIILAKSFYDIGYKNINWNLGCPYPMVAKKKRGAGLLPYPEIIQSFLDKVMPAIPNKLTIKTRLGMNKPDEIYKIIPIFNNYPIEELIIHARTGKQMYEGKTNLEFFGPCIDLSVHQIAYNGDINSLEIYENLKQRFPTITKWMIGRGAIENPFLPLIIKKQTDKLDNQIKLIKNFHDELFDKYREILYGPGHLLGKMKGLWFYLSNFFNDGKMWLKKIQKTKKINKYNKIIGDLLSEDNIKLNSSLSNK